MKCLKSKRTTKEHVLGEIVRVDDKTAFNMVGSSWEYVSKLEWKMFKGTKSGPSQDQVEVIKKENQKQSSHGADETPPFVKTRKKGKKD